MPTELQGYGNKVLQRMNVWLWFLKLYRLNKAFSQARVLILAGVSRFGVKGFGPKTFVSLRTNPSVPTSTVLLWICFQKLEFLGKQQKPPRMQMTLSYPFALQEWQKLNYDIYTLRQARKEVRSRWKHVLEDLGFQKEADSLLSVTKLSIISDSQNMGKARDILLKLSEETNIFPTSWELSERYLFVVDRLIALDAADEFFKMASMVYPKRPSGERVDESQKALQCTSVVMP
uniref:Melanoregulin n=1 Tax=Amazona collaria TaxID=241587 RepID=A0A8B9GDF6_9PSIT